MSPTLIRRWVAVTAVLYAPLVAASATHVTAQATSAEILSPESYLGYGLGEAFTDYYGIRDYARALAEVSPRVRYFDYGETVEGRELIQLLIASPDHQARLDEILAMNAELTRAGTSAERAREIAATNPAVVYFSYGIHGNESSSSEAALWTAYDLASGGAAVEGVLDSLVVVMDPVTNPDGRERYVQWYRSVVGAEPNPDPRTREHREPWPGGRYNHYLFDLNRDWAWMTQPETRARVATWWRWNPQVHVDFHEMGPNSTYFFFPAAPPINPIYPDHVLEWGRRFGEANARAFDVHGWSYFTGESFDMLYPGYGDSWPSLLGAIGMTYEQAGSGTAGLAIVRSDGDTLTLHDRASHHRTSGIATLREAAAGKTRLLLDFAEAHRTAGDDAADVLLVPGSDPSRLDALVEHLLAQGIEVERSAEPFRTAANAYRGWVARRDFPPGTVRVRADQPRGRLALTLLQAETELIAEYSYDISAWSLPYAYGVEAHRSENPPAAGWNPASSPPIGAEVVAPTNYGYLVPPLDDSSPAIVRYLEAGGLARVLGEASTFQGRDWPAGSWFLPVAGNENLSERVLSAGLAPFAVPVSSGLSERGMDLGSGRMLSVQLPNVALVGGPGVSATSYGAHWYHLEQQLGFPFDALLLDDLPSIELSSYDVIVLPDISGTLPEATQAVLSDWVRAGGRLVAVSGGAEAAAPIAEIEMREAPEPEEEEQDALDRLLTTREDRELESWLEEVPGAILEVRLDPGHPFAWGAIFDRVPDRLFVLHVGGRAFEPSDDAETVAFFGSQLGPTSGVISEANLSRLERGAWLLARPLGSGEVILFADDPLFRLFWKSTVPLYRNALLIGSR
ncbi:MAG: M14 family metallopeptidase [Gemmatimonadota bacterium]